MMGSDAFATDEIYQRIKTQIMAGRFAPGAALTIQRLAIEYEISISPVRDAMQRLLGEQMVTLRPGGGFHMPSMREPRARALYAWHGFLTRPAAGRIDRKPVDVSLLDRLDQSAVESDTGLTQLTADFFDTLAASLDNGEHRAAIHATGERLHALRLGEQSFPDRRAELQKLMELAAGGRSQQLRIALDRYHARRIRRTPVLVQLLNSRAEEDL